MTTEVPLDIAIRGYVSAYLCGKLTLREFETWFIPAAWDHTTDLTGEIELDLVELGNGDLTEGGFRHLLRQLISGPEVVVTAVSGGTVVTTYATFAPPENDAPEPPR